MKKIKLGAKLNLNKETVSKLNDGEMNSAKGGFLSLGEDCSFNVKCNTNGDITKGHWCSDRFTDCVCPA